LQIKKKLSPEWNEPFSIEVPPGASSLECCVYDESFAQFNTFMGSVLLRNVNRFRGGLVFKAHRLVYHSTLGLGVLKKKKRIGTLNPEPTL